MVVSFSLNFKGNLNASKCRIRKSEKHELHLAYYDWNNLMDSGDHVYK